MTISEKGNAVTTELYRHSTSNEKKNSNRNMLTQQRLPIHLDYLQAHITNSETKASPLALLAATCSSIGKGDKDECDVKTTTTTLNKLSTQEEDSKTSFKPYKLESNSTSIRNNPSSLMSSTEHSNPTPATSAMLPSRIPPISSVTDLEKPRCYPEATLEYPTPLKCHTSSPPLPHLSNKMPFLHGHRDHAECVQCKTMRPQSDPLPIVNRNHINNPGLCHCPMCNQARENLKCHYQGSPSMSPLYPPYKNPNLTPMITCRDPNCTHCSKFSHSNVQNFLHPALIHQCTHNASHKSSAYPIPPPSSHLSPYDSYMKNSHAPKPYVCNWVSEGKHCGSTFITSEELFQHLRTHTSAQQLSNCDKSHTLVPQTPTPCNIHGCPCSANQRKASPKQNVNSYGIGPSPRYSPYSRLLPSSINSLPGHSYGPHTLFHY